MKVRYQKAKGTRKRGYPEREATQKGKGREEGLEGEQLLDTPAKQATQKQRLPKKGLNKGRLRSRFGGRKRTGYPRKTGSLEESHLGTPQMPSVKRKATPKRRKGNQKETKRLLGSQGNNSYYKEGLRGLTETSYP